MSYTPGMSEVVPPMVSPFTLGWSPIAQERLLATTPSSGGWFSTNGALYVPVLVPTTCVVRRLWWANGATVSASYNIDCAIYADADYKPVTKLVSTGSTAQGTASEVQFVNVTDTTLAPGRYWIAMACSASAATFMRTGIADQYNAAVCFTEASALPLPATPTPAEPTLLYLYLCGFSTRP